MEKRQHYYVSRKNVLTWLMTLCMFSSAMARIILGSGMKGAGVWSQIVLPTAAVLLYALIILINGKEMFYKTAIPVCMMAIYSGIWVSGNVQSKMTAWMFWICLVFFCALYTELTSGKRRFLWLLPFMFLSPVMVIAYYHRQTLMAEQWMDLTALIPDMLALLGGFLMCFAIRIHPVGEYHPTWGDRCDGRKIRTLAPMAQISAYFQVERNSCSNLFEESIEITHIDRYIRQKRKEGLTDFGIVHVLLAAYVRGVAKYPQMNRFISGQKVYSRGEDIQYSMVVKKEMTLDAPDTSIKVHLSPRDTALDVYRKLNAAVEEVKSSQQLDSGLDHLIQHLNMVPSVVLKFLVWLLKLLDYFGLIPRFLLELSPFHGSLFFTSMGSLGIQPIYHHLYDFGNLPIFGAFGCKRRETEVREDGTLVQKKYVDVKFVLDERIVDGYYYASFFKHYRAILRHPELLDNPPEEVVRDID